MILPYVGLSCEVQGSPQQAVAACKEGHWEHAQIEDALEPAFLGEGKSKIQAACFLPPLPGPVGKPRPLC